LIVPFKFIVVPPPSPLMVRLPVPDVVIVFMSRPPLPATRLNADSPLEVLIKLDPELKTILAPEETARETPEKVELFVRAASKLMDPPELSVRGFAELLVMPAPKMMSLSP